MSNLKMIALLYKLSCVIKNPAFAYFAKIKGIIISAALLVPHKVINDFFRGTCSAAYNMPLIFAIYENTGFAPSADVYNLHMLLTFRM